MAIESVQSHGPLTCTVEISGDEVDAGMELTVTARASCPHGCDLTGQNVSIRDQSGAEVARAGLTTADGNIYVTNPCVLRAPSIVGLHTWHVVVAGGEAEGILHEETATTFSLATLAHAAHVNAWGAPSAIAAGERFTFHVGVKCSAGCRLSGRPLSILDHRGAQVATAVLQDDVWPGTSALYFAEVEATAPAAPGAYQWQVTTPECSEGLPHAAGLCRVDVKIVTAPDHEVTVEAFNSATNMPIQGIHVMCHPYRATTDERGIAKVEVAKGRYTLYVSGFNFMAYESIIDVIDDISIRVELTEEPEEIEDYR